MSRTGQLALKIGLPVLILLGAGGMTAQLIASREEPERAEKEKKAVLVDTERVERTSHRLDVRASGTVVPARQTEIQPQVGGRIRRLDESLAPGGIVEEGEVLVQIDRTDYELALEQQETALKQARAQLKIEEGQRDVARQEWELFKDEAKKEMTKEEYDPSLALREPQLESAKAQVAAAKSRVKQAKVNLQRTAVRAPFDGFIREESTELGQLVSTQSRLATLVGTDSFWVRLSLPTSKLEAIDIPSVNAEEGSKATVRYGIGERTVEREARVIRLLGDLDPAGRMARILVEIKDPLGLDQVDGKKKTVRGIPLLLDAYVDVSIEGNAERQLIEVPRETVQNGNEVYVYDDGKLAVRTVKIAWRRPDTVLIDTGLEEGDLLITSPLPQPVEGMPLKRSDGSAEAPAETDESSKSEPTEADGESEGDSRE